MEIIDLKKSQEMKDWKWELLTLLRDTADYFEEESVDKVIEYLEEETNNDEEIDDELFLFLIACMAVEELHPNFPAGHSLDWILDEIAEKVG